MIKSNLELIYDGASSSITINGSSYFWIFGGRRIKDKDTILEQKSRSILFNLDNWKDQVHNGIEIYIKSTSAGNVQGPVLPFIRHGHCAVKFNQTYLYVIGGFNNRDEFQWDVWTFNGFNEEWNKIESKGRFHCGANYLRHQSNCALFVRYLLESIPGHRFATRG